MALVGKKKIKLETTALAGKKKVKLDTIANTWTKAGFWTTRGFFEIP